MKSSLLSHNLEIVLLFNNSSIASIQRQLYRADLPQPDFEEMADGPIELTLNGGEIINFFSMTTINSVGIEKGRMPLYGDSYVFHGSIDNEFWQQRKDRKIISATILQSEFYSPSNPSEFGLEFQLENGNYFCIEYLSEDDVPDQKC